MPGSEATEATEASSLEPRGKKEKKERKKKLLAQWFFPLSTPPLSSFLMPHRTSKTLHTQTLLPPPSSHPQRTFKFANHARSQPWPPFRNLREFQKEPGRTAVRLTSLLYPSFPSLTTRSASDQTRTRALWRSAVLSQILIPGRAPSQVKGAKA